MGELNVIPVVKDTDIRAYSQLLFADLQALEDMMEQGLIEEGVTRIGVEQELCLIDQFFRPAPLAEEVLAAINDPHFTTELARFNLEINLDPILLTGDCFSRLYNDLKTRLEICSQAAFSLNSYPLITGILPTIRSSDLEMEFMSPRQRYAALNKAILHIRNGPQEFHIQGADELMTQHQSVMFESCNTSFQVHYQLGASSFTSSYNWAQAITAPVLAACTNSPLFMGKRLWRETRIALFQQATDTRAYKDELRKTKPRVLFGDHWMSKDLTELIKEDISTYRPLVIREGLKNSREELANGRVPDLKAFSLYNGTIYRWNRPCYGITANKPHLRIENRYLPAGPTILDEVANAAFWLGLMHTPERPQVERDMEFVEVKANFIKAARNGLNAKLSWIGGRSYDASDLILKELLPKAKQGLDRAGVNPKDCQQYLEIIEQRVISGKTGSTWILNAFNKLSKKLNEDTARVGLTEVMHKRQQQGLAVHLWPEIQESEVSDGPHHYRRVDQIMSKKLYTVSEDDIIDLVPNIMKWNQIRHMLVEDSAGNLVGLVTMGRLGQYYAEHEKRSPAVKVKEVMIKEVITITANADTLEALQLMRDKQIGCLPVLNQQKKLVGIITEKDFFPIVHSYLSGLGPDIAHSDR